MDAATPQGRAALALTLLAIDPQGLGGLHLRGRAGGARDGITGLLNVLPSPRHRLPPDASDDQLFGALDLAATLAGDRIVHAQGVLARAGTLVLPMAERISPRLAGRLAAAADRGGPCLVALDEGTEDEGIPAALADRLAFSVDLTDSRGDVFAHMAPDRARIAAAQAALPRVQPHPQQIADLTETAARFGIQSLRAPLFALRAALAHAALMGRDAPDGKDMEVAAILTLAHRATVVPEDAAQEEPQDTPDDRPQDENEGEDTLDLPEDLLLEAVKAALPDDVLDRLAAGAAKGGTGSGSGARRKSNRRGRPLPARPGRLDGTNRIDVIATLRAAAPWQTLRERGDGPVRVWPSDIHVKRFEELSDRLLIFTVDASGSAAIARLAEAKGAIELLLSDAYARRDHVALVSFRGTEAEVLLPPTRSLVQTKRRLAALPGGGGTPLAAGLEAAMSVAQVARARGLTPTVVLLTDGRANIARDGSVDRAQAAQDAQAVARGLRGAGVDAIVIDTGNRPERSLAQLSDTLGGHYVVLPRADAQRLSAAVQRELAG